MRNAVNNRKQIIRNKLVFEEYFSAFKARKEYLSSNLEKVNSLDFTVDTYNDIVEKLKKNSQTKEIIKQEAELLNNEHINEITEEVLFDLIINFIKAESNVLIYGFGSKLKLIYDFIGYFQNTINCGEEAEYHLLVFNCYNPEITIRFILNKIIETLSSQLEEIGKEFDFKKERSIEGLISFIDTVIRDIYIKRLELNHRFLVIINNIDGFNFQSKQVQESLSKLMLIERFHFICTTDNAFINYFWSQNTKDNFSFYYLKFHTFMPYELEMNDKNSLIGDKTRKNISGLKDILKALSGQQKELLVVIAKKQLKNEWETMNGKSIVEYIVNEGLGICNNIHRFQEMIVEYLDHNILVEKQLKDGKNYYKLNLGDEIVKQLGSGELNEVEDDNSLDQI